MTETRRRDPTPGLRRFVGRVTLFLVPLAVAAGLLLLLDPGRAFAWWFVKGDTRGRGVSIYERTSESAAPVTLIDNGHVSVTKKRVAPVNDIDNCVAPVTVDCIGFVTCGRLRRGCD